MDPHIGPISNKKVTGVAIPLLNTQGQFDGLIGASLQLESLTTLWDRVFTRHGVEGLVLDRQRQLVGRSAGLVNLESLDDILSVVDTPKSISEEFASNGVSYTFSNTTSKTSQWHFVTIKPTLNPFNHLLATKLGWVTLIFGFVILAFYALLIVRREGAFVRRLINTEEMLRNQRNKLKVITEEQTSDIRQKDQSYRHLFDNNEVSIWNEDLSTIHATFKQMRLNGVSDLSNYLDKNPELLEELISQVRVINVNKATLKLFCAKSEHDFMLGIESTFGSNATSVFKAELEAIWDKKPSFRAEAEFKTLEGDPLYAIISFQIPETAEGFESIPVTILDITEIKQSEDALRLSTLR